MWDFGILPELAIRAVDTYVSMWVSHSHNKCMRPPAIIATGSVVHTIIDEFVTISVIVKKVAEPTVAPRPMVRLRVAHPCTVRR